MLTKRVMGEHLNHLKIEKKKNTIEKQSWERKGRVWKKNVVEVFIQENMAKIKKRKMKNAMKSK